MEIILKYKWIIVSFFIVVIIVVASIYYNKNEIVYIPEITDVALQVFVYVDVKGAVADPGVKKISSGMRVSEVIELAGGALDNANTDVINMSRLVEDQDLIIVPFINEGLENSMISINTATQSELETIPGIGESKAKDIINYRVKTPFKLIDEIMNVSGIGESTFDKIKTFITL